ncbi:carboxynorspermidine decarboxylase [Herbinix luporum]|jgi:carboxynorspermidine decarboxylase|uniref:Carboxynorspermidine/carboxyspermidinedecarboxy lase n=1 Tax=Herbinix luporum TaxID=1679721 RepID=A0A0K8J5Z5_9FIRM|nr:carboxynorspermidine decarboxylase [Herbinix luporum]MDI9488549.1 carboxynorspermidine decarboxylase [Bacillota bacterium]CUH92890.1 Carboxynorspermidine/carboxyspermidinedecarboxy lase [Herbinix luporum]
MSKNRQNFKTIDFNIDISKLPTPIYIVDERLLEKNLKILKSVMDSTNCKILLAQKAFSMFYLYPLIGNYLKGTAASSLFEARLGFEKMKGREVHIYSPAYKEEEFDEILRICDYIIFNSFTQWNKYKDKVKAARKKTQCGLRINPEYSEIGTDIYNPCYTGSRLGITLDNFREDDLQGIDGLHFHTMCEQNSDVLKRTLEVVDRKFGKYIEKMKWVNFGGGHHITKPDYDINTLTDCIMYIKNKYGVEVYLEPGEAIALNAGYLAARVLDIVKNNMDIAILDTSAACHMPDVIEMPYKPKIIGAGEPGDYPYTYRLGGLTCLAGDVIGDYSFKEPLQVGDILIFTDMAIYTFVKNNTFNGVNLPSLASYNEKEGLKIIKQFGYEDFKERLS